MDSFYSENELKAIGFKYVGNNVKISRKISIYSPELISIGNDVRIDDFCILSGLVEIGNYVHVAAFTALYGGQKGIFIGDFVNLSSRVCIYSVSDDYSGEYMAGPMLPEEYRKVEEEAVHIGRHSIIGSTSIVMPGIIIGEGTACGAFSFVNQNTEPWTVNVGIPCRKIRNRKKDLLELEKKFISQSNTE